MTDRRLGVPPAILALVSELPRAGTPMPREWKDRLTRTMEGLVELAYPEPPAASEPMEGREAGGEAARRLDEGA